MADGSQPFVDEAMLGQSINAKLVAAGLAYVEPYDSMPIALVRHLRTIIATARQANMGLLGMENVSKTQTGRVPDLATLQTLIMWPKLFRRLTAYFAEGFNGLGQFDNWVRLDPINRDDLLRLPDGELGNMHDTYRVSETRRRSRLIIPKSRSSRPTPARDGRHERTHDTGIPASRLVKPELGHSSSGGRSIIQPICHLWSLTQPPRIR